MRKRINIVSYIRQYAAASRRSRDYKRAILNIARKVDAFSNHLGKTLYTDSFSDRMMDEFIYYLRSQPENYKITTIKSLFEKLSQMLSRAGRDGYKVDYSFKDITIKDEDACSVYLTEEEIEKIFALKKLSAEQHAARERFVIACCTGLRYSDVSQLTEDHLHDSKIQIKTRKTGAVVELPQHWMVRDIIKRNRGRLPGLKSQQAFNTIIKRIARKAGIKQKVLYERTEGLKVVRKNLEKWQLISSHTARRSLATNLHLHAVPTKRIMLLTGHTTEQAFFKYIRINRAENAEILSNHPFFSGKKLPGHL